MACNCKRATEIEDKLGTREGESFFGKVFRWLMKTIIFVISVLMAIVVTPILICVVIYKLFFSKNRTIVLPKQLQKFLE
jgi:hypothetical protein